MTPNEVSQIQQKENDIMNNYAHSFLEDEAIKRKNKSSNNISLFNDDKSFHSTNLPAISQNVLKNIENLYCDSCVDVLKQANLTDDDIQQLRSSRYDFSKKAAEAIEYFNKALVDSEIHIDLLMTENEKLLIEINELKMEPIVRKMNYLSDSSEEERNIKSVFNKTKQEVKGVMKN